MKDFFNLYRHGFVRLAVATPLVRVGDPAHNGDATEKLMREAAREKALLAVFPELGLPAYSCEDLFHQQALIEASEAALERLLAGARVIATRSASTTRAGRPGSRRELASNQSARCMPAYLYSAAGLGESTTALAWDGDAMVFENGNLLAESRRFSNEPQLALADIDLGRLLADRMRQNTFADSARRHPGEIARFRSVDFSLPLF